jgi:hypothetical protein
VTSHDPRDGQSNFGAVKEGEGNRRHGACGVVGCAADTAPDKTRGGEDWKVLISKFDT